MPNDPQTLILSVPGTQETRELDFTSIRDAIARGEIGLDNWAWSVDQNDWLPLGQLPPFIPAQIATHVYEQPVANPNPVPQPQIERLSVKVPQAVKAFVPAAAVATPAFATPNRLAATYYSKPMETSNEFPIFKTLFVILGLLIGGLVGVNYYMVDQPYHDNLAKTPYATIQTHAHLGAFVQPNALLIHLRPTSEITSDNFADVLATLMKCAPSQAFQGRPFTSVALTSAWLGEYVISADNWKDFSDLGGLSPDQKKDFVLERLVRMDGEPLVGSFKKDTAAEKKAREDKAWDALVAHFQPAAS